MNICEILQHATGSDIITIDTLTPVILKGGKKNPHQGRVMKLVLNSSVMVFANHKTNAYENMVERRLKQEGKDPASFVLSERIWGSRIPHFPLVQHIKEDKTKYYLEVIFLHAGQVSYFLDGESVSKNEIIGLEDRPEGEQGGLENKVIIRTYDLNNIIRLHVNKADYEGPFFVDTNI